DLVYALARSGRRDSAKKVLAALQRDTGNLRHGSARQQGAFSLIWAYVGLGMRDSALSAIAKTMDERGAFIVLIATDPLLDEIRGDPRFIAQLKRAHLPYRAP